MNKKGSMRFVSMERHCNDILAFLVHTEQVLIDANSCGFKDALSASFRNIISGSGNGR